MSSTSTGAAGRSSNTRREHGASSGCRDGHLCFVLEGAIRYEFEDGGDVLTANEGEAFSLSTGRAHRGRNIADAPTRLFLIDDPERA
ncbi:MAG: cupin domain-containing protein [Solirubrobacterales bacterium]|nr:cupin domain-containing protein [Solirubrobacterales bacterium]